jgi:hypothetical protein
MAKIKQSAYKSTGDRAPPKPIPKLDTRVSTAPKPMKKRDDQSSDAEMFSASTLSNVDSSQDSIVIPMAIQTRSGKPPQKEHHEVGRIDV